MDITRSIAAAVLCVPLWGPGPTGAAAVQSTTCDFGGLTLILTPAINATSRAFTFHNNSPGWVECTGPVRGHEPTGRGQWLLDRGTATGSCAGGSGDFLFRFRIPTRDGATTLTDRGRFAYGPLQGGAYGGRFDGDVMSGGLTVTPSKGNCVTEPISRTVPTAHGTLRN
jgi:hypothetical protein